MSREVLQMALDALEQWNTPLYKRGTVITAIEEALAQPEQDQFKPDWNTEAVLVEEIQRMAKRIEDLEAMLERQTARIVDLQTHIENFDGEDR